MQVADIVRAHRAVAVERITIEVGSLSGAEPELLRNAFLAMRTGPTSRATLRIDRIPVSIRCRECGADSETPPNRLVCAHCGGWRIRLTGGDELRLRRVELRATDALTCRALETVEPS